MAFNEFPYTNFHELNADWILQTVKQAREIIDNLNTTITAMQHMDTSMQTEITGLQHANDAINAQLDTIETTLADHTDSLETFAELIAEIRGELGAMQAAVNSLLSRTTSIEGMLADTYDETQHYFKPAIVREDGKLWRCIVDESVPSGATGQFDETDWTEINVGDELALLQTRFSALAGVVDEMQQAFDTKLNTISPRPKGLLFISGLTNSYGGLFISGASGENLSPGAGFIASGQSLQTRTISATGSISSTPARVGGARAQSTNEYVTLAQLLELAPLVVSFTTAAGVTTCSHTFEQILSAYNARQPIYAQTSGDGLLLANACIEFHAASGSGLAYLKFTWFSVNPASQYEDWSWDSVSITMYSDGSITYSDSNV